MKTKDLLISKINKREPINVKIEDCDLGTFTYDKEKKRYAGFGNITLEKLKKILESETDEWEWLKIE